MEGFCRACLVKFDDSSNLYPYSEKNRRLFVYSTGLQVKRNDNIIFQICKDCYSGMKYACTFKKNCRNSDRKLKSYFTLKEDGDSTDLSSYLKNNDETLKLRLPLNIGSSTPANHRREDDNDSTCTSIQNFMTDILPPVDIPDNEAKIIREVIEEEADILEDSLDSHWLHDDSSVDTDFRLDFSFSPFATPRLIKDDHCYSPIKKQDHPSVQPRYQTHKKVEKFLDTHYGIKDVSLQKLLDANFDSPLKEFDCPLKAFSVEQTCSIDLNLDNSLKKDQTCTVDLNLDNALKKDQICTIDNLDNALRKDQVCSIDLNLDNALKRDTECVSLDRILTPTVRDDISAPATPLITNILFGDKVEEELDEKENDKRMEDDIDVIEEFLNVNVKCEENIIETTDVKVNEEEGKKVKVGKTVEKVTKEELAQTNKFCITNFYCKMCNKKFRHLKGLKIHSNKYHKMKIDFTPKKKQARRKMVCDICGMIFQTPRCLISHLENHNKPTSFSCKYCPLQFSSQVRVNMHMTTHTGVVAESKKERKHVCTVCGKAFSSSSNYSTHMRRHKKAFTFACEECGKHFYRTTDLNTHMRRHTGARPYSCTSCHKSYSRSDALNRHMKMHSGILPFPCSFCDKKFPKASELRLHLKHNKACILLQASAAKT